MLANTETKTGSLWHNLRLLDLPRLIEWALGMENGESLEQYSDIPQKAKETNLTATENESEYESDEELLLSKKDPPTVNLTLSGRVRLYLSGVNWRNVFAAVCLWIAFTLCSAAFSMIAPFFPQEVFSKKLIIAADYV